MPSFNCQFTLGNFRTLGALRIDLMRRLGYSAQAANPPPGMAELLNSFLIDAQEQLHRQYPSLHTERFFTWDMIPGERYYGLDEDSFDASDEAPPFLDPHQVTWVGVEDLNGTWLPLVEGIPPTFYTRTDLERGLPSRYEIRSCIEVFPAPQEEYKLRVKGRFGLAPFTEDDDPATIDDRPVLLLALANAKAHYGQPDADRYSQQAFNYILNLVAGSHHTARYIPNGEDRVPLPKPVFLPLQGD